MFSATSSEKGERILTNLHHSCNLGMREHPGLLTMSIRPDGEDASRDTDCMGPTTAVNFKFLPNEVKLNHNAGRRCVCNFFGSKRKSTVSTLVTGPPGLSSYCSATTARLPSRRTVPFESFQPGRVAHIPCLTFLTCSKAFG